MSDHSPTPAPQPTATCGFRALMGEVHVCAFPKGHSGDLHRADYQASTVWFRSDVSSWFAANTPANLGVCHRCGNEIPHFVTPRGDTIGTSGFYYVRSEPWERLARGNGELYVCNACMWADPLYIAEYGGRTPLPPAAPQEGTTPDADATIATCKSCHRFTRLPADNCKHCGHVFASVSSSGTTPDEIERIEGLVRLIVESFRDAPNPSVEIAVEEIMATFDSARVSVALAWDVRHVMEWIASRALSIGDDREPLAALEKVHAFLSGKREAPVYNVRDMLRNDPMCAAIAHHVRASLTSSQTDSSLRAAEPTTCEWSVTGDGSFRCVRAKGHNGLHEVLFGDDEHFAASSPTVTPPQTWPDLWCEACREYVPVTDDATKSECGVGEAPYDLCCTRCAAILATYQPSNPEAASPPVTEEAPNEEWLKSDNGFPRANRMDLWTEAERAIQHAVDVCETTLPADVLETDAIILLGKAREKVARLVDREIRAGRMAMPNAAPMPRPLDTCGDCGDPHWKHLGGPCKVDGCACVKFRAFAARSTPTEEKTNAE